MAAVIVLEAVEVFGLVGAHVFVVRDPIRIVVGVGTSVIVLEAVEILGSENAGRFGLLGRTHGGLTCGRFRPGWSGFVLLAGLRRFGWQGW